MDNGDDAFSNGHNGRCGSSTSHRSWRSTCRRTRHAPRALRRSSPRSSRCVAAHGTARGSAAARTIRSGRSSSPACWRGRVDVGGYPGLDLYGPGDVIAARDLHHTTLPCGESWTATVPSRIALLDDRFLLAARRWPRLVSAHVRAARRAARPPDDAARDRRAASGRGPAPACSSGSSQTASAGSRREGITIQLALTHEALGRLIGARRPTVTLALRMLCERGALERRPGRSWLVKELPQDTAVTAAVLSDGTQPRPVEPEPVSSPS